MHDLFLIDLKLDNSGSGSVDLLSPLTSLLRATLNAILSTLCYPISCSLPGGVSLSLGALIFIQMASVREGTSCHHLRLCMNGYTIIVIVDADIDYVNIV